MVHDSAEGSGSGAEKAEAYKNKCVAASQIITGEFSGDDTVTVTTNGNDVTAKILDAIECSDCSTFETEPAVDLGKHKIQAGRSACILTKVWKRGL